MIDLHIDEFVNLYQAVLETLFGNFYSVDALAILGNEETSLEKGQLVIFLSTGGEVEFFIMLAQDFSKLVW